MMKSGYGMPAAVAFMFFLSVAGFAGGPTPPKAAAAESAATEAPAEPKAAEAAPLPAAGLAPAVPESEASEWEPVPATGGTLGLFTIETGETLPRKGFTTSAYANKSARAPGSISVLGVGWSVGVGLTDWLNVYLDFEPHRHVHVGQPQELSLNSPTTNPQFDSTVYRVLAPLQSPRPAYVEDYPFAFQSNGGLGDIALGVKISPWSEQRGASLSFSIRNDFIIPTRTQLADLLDVQGQTGAFQDQIGLALSKSFRGAVTGVFNGAYRFTRNPVFHGVSGLDQADQVRVGAGLLFLPDERFQPMTEYTGVIFTGNHTPNMTLGPRDPVDGVWGFRLYLLKYMAVDVGYRYMVNLKQVEDRHGFVLKLSTVYWARRNRF